MKNKQRKNYTLIVKENGLEVQRLTTHLYRKFYDKLKQINWQNRALNIYLRISYGKKLDVWGKMSEFHNDGWYDNKEDLWKSFKLFQEEN